MLARSHVEFRPGAKKKVLCVVLSAKHNIVSNASHAFRACWPGNSASVSLARIMHICLCRPGVPRRPKTTLPRTGPEAHSRKERESELEGRKRKSDVKIYFSAVKRGKGGGEGGGSAEV